MNFKQTIECGMIQVGIRSKEHLCDRTGIPNATLYRRLKHPQGTTAAELAALSDVLGIPIGELAEATRKKGLKIA